MPVPQPNDSHPLSTISSSSCGGSTLSQRIQAYRQSILTAAGTSQQAGSAAIGPHVPAQSGTAPLATSSTAAASATAAQPKGADADKVRLDLDGLQSGIAKDLRTAMQRAGLSLTGTLTCKVKSDGSLDIAGNAADKASAAKVLNATPTLARRIGRIFGQAYDAANTRQAAMSSAARFAGAGQSGQILALYQTLVGQVGGSAAVFSVSAQGSQLAFSGSVSTRA